MIHHSPNESPQKEARPRFGAIGCRNGKSETSRSTRFTQGREIPFHALAVQNVKRTQVIELLVEVNAKLGVPIETAIRNGGVP
jgi:hypothetical protein